MSVTWPGETTILKGLECSLEILKRTLKGVTLLCERDLNGLMGYLPRMQTYHADLTAPTPTPPGYLVLFKINECVCVELKLASMKSECFLRNIGASFMPI